MRKNRLRYDLTVALLAAVLLTEIGCGARKTSAAKTAAATPARPTSSDSDLPAAQTQTLRPTADPTPVPTPMPTSVPTPVLSPKPTLKPTPRPTPKPSPEPSQEPIQSGTYEGSEGSVLQIEEDGSVIYKTKLHGTMNEVPMTADVIFYGTVDNSGNFFFHKITYLGMDITAIAARHGFTDATPWEKAARALYRSAQ